jgi:SET family sugar efflux transporter-like MFS transporter
MISWPQRCGRIPVHTLRLRMTSAVQPRVHGLSPALVPLGLMFLAVGISSAVVMPFLSLFLSTQVHATPDRITVFLVVAPLAGVLVSSMIGRLSDRFPVRQQILVGAALAGVAGATTTAFVRNYWVLLALAVTATALAGSLFPQTFAYARQVLERDNPGRTATGISTLRTVFSLAWVGGPPFAAVALGAGGFRLLYGLAAAMYALAALVAAFGLRNVPPVPSPTIGAPSDADKNRPPRVLLLTLAAFVLLQVPGTLGIQAMPLFIQHDLHGDPASAGLVLGLCAALEIPLMLGLGVLTTRYRLRPLVLAGVGCGVAYYAIVLVAPNVWTLGAAQAVNAVYISAAAGIGISYVQDLLPGHPGYVTTLFTNTFPIGQAIAGPLLGIAAHFGYRLAYGMGAALCAAGLLLLLRARPQPRDELPEMSVLPTTTASVPCAAGEPV